MCLHVYLAEREREQSFGAHSSGNVLSPNFGHYYLFLAFSFSACECIKCYHIHKYIPLYMFTLYISCVRVCARSGSNSYRPFFRTPDINLVWDTGFFPPSSSFWPGVCLFAIIGGVFVVVVVVGGGVVAATLHLPFSDVYFSIFFSPSDVAPSHCVACVCVFARNNTQLATVYNLVVVK